MCGAVITVYVCSTGRSGATCNCAIHQPVTLPRMGIITMQINENAARPVAAVRAILIVVIKLYAHLQQRHQRRSIVWPRTWEFYIAMASEPRGGKAAPWWALFVGIIVAIGADTIGCIGIVQSLFNAKGYAFYEEFCILAQHDCVWVDLIVIWMTLEWCWFDGSFVSVWDTYGLTY